MNKEEFRSYLELCEYELMDKFENEKRDLYIDPTGNMPMIVVRPDDTVGFEYLAGSAPHTPNQYTLADAMLLLMAVVEEKHNALDHPD